MQQKVEHILLKVFLLPLSVVTLPLRLCLLAPKATTASSQHYAACPRLTPLREAHSFLLEDPPPGSHNMLPISLDSATLKALKDVIRQEVQEVQAAVHSSPQKPEASPASQSSTSSQSNKKQRSKSPSTGAHAEKKAKNNSKGFQGFNTGTPTCLFSDSLPSCKRSRAVAPQALASLATTPCIGCKGASASFGTLCCVAP